MHAKKNIEIMKQIVLNIPESEYHFFMKVIKNFHFVKVDEKKNKQIGRASCRERV